jgi:GNAT superfamily N-acetyltransferase
MIKIEPEQIQSNAKQYALLCKSTWSPIIQASAVGYAYWENLFTHFPEYQLIYEDKNGEIIGFANTIPLYYDNEFSCLPDTGWDWLIAKGHTDYESGRQPNLLGGLQIGVNPKHRSRGYSKILLAKAKALQQSKQLSRFILPIRPTMKYLHPEVNMEEYMFWKEGGKIYDPWIRTHLKSGAQIIKVCPEAMRVEGKIEDWEKWSGIHFKKSGKYPIEGGLSLVDIDMERDKGLYLEPNIWIYYA